MGKRCAGADTHTRAGHRARQGRKRLGRLLVLMGLWGMICQEGAASLGRELEEAVGRLALAELQLRYGGIVREPLLQDWIERLAAPLVAQTQRGVPYRFYILAGYEDNAFSLPGGHICLLQGLLSHISSEEELAGVIAHELAHSENRDFQRMLEQQLLYMGVLGLLRGLVSREWIYAGQIIQLLEGLRQQRGHEIQADQRGAELAYKARYDPQGVLSYLQGIGPSRGWAGELLATHPSPQKRMEAVRRHIRALQANDYEGLLALGEGLERRLQWRRAAQIYAQAEKLCPERPEAPQKLAALQQKRGFPETAAAAPLSLPEDILTQIQQKKEEWRRQAQKQYEWERRLQRVLRALAQDRETAQAWELAQIIAPEIEEPAYLATLARAHYALSAARYEAGRHWEILSRSGAIRLAWERCATALLARPHVPGATEANRQELQQAAQEFAGASARGAALTKHLEACCRSAQQLREATRLVALAFLALVGSGAGQPLGRLNWTRFALLQSDIVWAEQQLKKVRQTSQQAYGALLREHLKALHAHILILHAQAQPALRRWDCMLLARRLPGLIAYDAPDAMAGINSKNQANAEEAGAGVPRSLPEALNSLWKEEQMTEERWRALDCLLRLCYLDMRAEREN